MKVLVTGAGGMLGRDVVSCLSSRNYEVVPLVHAELDITDEVKVEAVVKSIQPDMIFNCAAFTKVDRAEREEILALNVNSSSVRNLCEVCCERELPLVHFSTDYVFDGTKNGSYTVDDTPNPLGAYGRSKLLGEKHILERLTRFYIIRTSWLFGHHGKNFVETMLELGCKRQKLSVVNDQRGCPTWTRHLAEATAELIETKRYGTYHVSNSEATTWFDFAREIFSLYDMNVDVVPITSEEFPTLAKRPLNSVLDPAPLPNPPFSARIYRPAIPSARPSSTRPEASPPPASPARTGP